MILDADVVGIGRTIGDLGPTALLGVAIAALIWDRVKMKEEMETLRKENTEMQKAAVTKAEMVTQKVADALHATERAWEKNTDSTDHNSELLKSILRKLG